MGKYRLIAELGRGGMGQVYLAVMTGMSASFSKLVVVKKLHDYLATDREFAEMFLDEARIAARLNHPNVVQTLEAATGDHGGLFLVMEYLDGQPLHRIVEAAKDDLPLEMHVAVLTDVLAGLHHAHELTDFDGSPLAVVHRDVTPHNVFVTYDGQIKVVDFGIARAEGRTTKTKHGHIKGKIPYMAPEQARAEVVDRRADVFAVGVMLFEAVTGERYWGSRRDADVRRSLAAGELPIVADDAADPGLVAVCRRALQPRREDRYESALAMQRDLESFAADKLARPSSLQIGAEVEALFADRRRATRQVIEAQFAALASATDDGPQPTALPRAPEADATPTRIEPRTEPAVLPIGPSPTASPNASSSSRRALFVSAALIAAAVALAWWLPSRDGEPKKASIALDLRDAAPSARFRIDDGPWLPNPYQGTALRDDAEHTITSTVDDPGARVKTRSVVVRFDGDVHVTIAR